MYPPFPVSWQKGVRPCITFPKPPSHPGRSDFPSPVGSNSVSPETLPTQSEAHSPAFTPGVSDLISSSTFFVVTLLTDTSSAVVHEMPSIYREPLCLLEVLPPKGRCQASPRPALPGLHRSYGLMRQTKILLPISVLLYGRSLQVIASPCWKLALPDVISVDLSLDALDPIPEVPITSLVRPPLASGSAVGQRSSQYALYPLRITSSKAHDSGICSADDSFTLQNPQPCRLST